MTTDATISLSEKAYIQVRKDILQGYLLPGTVVSERELANRYEMSKTPIREAVTQVCREGLIQRLPGRGYMVSPITIKEIQDLYDMRLILELATVEKMINQPSPEHLLKLEQISPVKYVHDEPKSHEIFLNANREFHLTLADASGNARLVQTLETLLLEMDRLFYLGLRLRDYSSEMAGEHCDLVNSLKEGDEKSAKECMREQITTSKNRILEAIMKGEFSSIQAIG